MDVGEEEEQYVTIDYRGHDGYHDLSSKTSVKRTNECTTLSFADMNIYGR